MDYKSGFEEKKDVLLAANDAVFDQNRRFEMLGSLHDNELRQMAESGVKSEQQSSVEERASTYEQIPDDVFSRWEELLARIDELALQAQSVLERESDILAELDIALQISPSMSEQLNDIAQNKLEIIAAEAATLEREIQELRSLELGYVAIYTAWNIPRAIELATVVEDIDSSQLDTSLQPSDQPIFETEPYQTDTEDKIGKEEVLDDSDKLKIFWAIIDHLITAGEAGVRLEEMRREVPELSGLSKEQYTQFKEYFSSIGDTIEDKLNSMGLNVKWIVSGRTRGTKYAIKENARPDESPNSFFPSRNTVLARPSIDTSPQVLVGSQRQEDIPEKPQAASTTISPSTQPQIVADKAPEIEDTQSGTTEAGSLLAADAEKKEAEEPIFSLIAKNRSGATARSGLIEISEATLDETLSHLGCKRDRELSREVTTWIEWLQENPTSQASRKIRSFAGVRPTNDRSILLPLFRFSPKDAPELTVRKHHMRNRLVYVIYGGAPVMVDMLDHDEFDRKYK